jgi:hypothetical protein
MGFRPLVDPAVAKRKAVPLLLQQLLPASCLASQLVDSHPGQLHELPQQVTSTYGMAKLFFMLGPKADS